MVFVLFYLVCCFSFGEGVVCLFSGQVTVTVVSLLAFGGPKLKRTTQDPEQLFINEVQLDAVL